MHSYHGINHNFHYNSDMSGDVIITNNAKGSDESIEILGEDILNFVAEYVRSQKIGSIEQQNTMEILGLK